MFGYPNTHPLSKLGEELLQVHTRVTKDAVGQEDGLLRQLEQARAGDTSGGDSSGGGRKHMQSPLVLEAVMLIDSIKHDLEQHPYVDDSRQPLGKRVLSLIRKTDDPAHTADLLERWRDSIRELLEPTKHFPLRGVRCPHCLGDTAPAKLDGEVVMVPVLEAYPTLESVWCRVCDITWEGDALHYLAAGATFAIAADLCNN